jgi:polysaccharide deacetylase family protein (PEP-CTERM system associated)
LRKPEITNVMSVDVEDYFQVGAFEHTIPRDDWARWPCRVEANIERILALFARHDIRATFFTLGWIAERYPAMVRSIVDAGHELASHGYGHQRASALTATEFRADVTRAKALLEDIAGQAGQRLPCAQLLHRQQQSVGARRAGGNRASLQFQHLSHRPRSLRHAGRPAFSLSPGTM